MISKLDNKTRLGSILLLLVAIAYLQLSFSVPIDTSFSDEAFNARTMPRALAIATIICALSQLAFSRAASADDSAPESTDNERLSSSLVATNWRPVLGLLGLMFIYSLCFEWLGFMLAGAGFLFCGFLLLGERRYGLAALVAFGLVGGLWAALTQLFGLYLDHGDLYRLIIEIIQ